jgi:hypothetical protein
VHGARRVLDRRADDVLVMVPERDSEQRRRVQRDSEQRRRVQRDSGRRLGGDHHDHLVRQHQASSFHVLSRSACTLVIRTPYALSSRTKFGA